MVQIIIGNTFQISTLEKNLHRLVKETSNDHLTSAFSCHLLPCNKREKEGRKEVQSQRVEGWETLSRSCYQVSINAWKAGGEKRRLPRKREGKVRQRRVKTFEVKIKGRRWKIGAKGEKKERGGGGGRKTVAIAGRWKSERERERGSRRVALSTDDRGGVSGRRGTLASRRDAPRLIVASPFESTPSSSSPSWPFHQLFPPNPSPRGKQFSSSQNPVTPRRAHPETDDKVHPATPAYHPLAPPLPHRV